MALTRIVTLAVLLALAAPVATSADQLVLNTTPTFRSVGDEWVPFNGFVYFAANDDVHGNELWRTDGTEAGTTLVADLYPGNASNDSNPSNFRVVGNRLFFRTGNPSPGADGYYNFFIESSGGAPQPIKFPGGDPANGRFQGQVGDKVLVRHLENGNSNYGLYVLGQTGDTLSKISSGFNNIGTEPMATLNGKAYFSSATGANSATELWVTDGTAGNTEMLKDILDGPDGSSPYDFIATGNRVYFIADDGNHGRELFVTDGTADGTRLLRDQHPGTPYTSISEQTANGNVLYFISNDPATGTEPWRTDGTTDGTRVVKDTVAGPDGSGQYQLEAFKDGFAMLRVGAIWYSDGTAEGTVEHASMDGDGYGPAHLTAAGDHAYWRGGFSPRGGSVWRMDGTPAGTFALTAGAYDNQPQSGGPLAGPFTPLGTKIIFPGYFPIAAGSGIPGGSLRVYAIDRTKPDIVRSATTQPTLSGTPAAGQTLTADPGTWVGEPSDFTYEWLRNGTHINNVAGTTYKLNTSSDVGAQISFRVTARGFGIPNVVTADTAAVTVTGAAATPSPSPSASPGPSPSPTPALTVSKKAKLKGKAKVGKKLKLTLPKLAQSGTTLSFRWFANGKRIKKQSKSSLKLKKKLKGKRISAKITIKKAGYETLTLTVGPTGKVKGK